MMKRMLSGIITLLFVLLFLGMMSSLVYGDIAPQSEAEAVNVIVQESIGGTCTIPDGDVGTIVTVTDLVPEGENTFRGLVVNGVFYETQSFTVTENCQVYAVFCDDLDYEFGWLLSDDGKLIVFDDSAEVDYANYYGAPWYEVASDVKEVVLRNGTERVGDYVFYNCAITKIILTDGMKEIGDYAFHYSAFTAVTLPEGLEIIGDYAFYSNHYLEKINLPDSLKKLGKGAFSYCYDLKKIEIPGGITRIEDYTFSCCYDLQQIVLPENLESIGTNAFAYSGILTVNIPSSVKSIGAGAFSNSDILTIDIPSSVNSIGYNAFGYCKNLSSVRIPDNVTVLESNTFSECEKLESVVLSQNLTSIGDSAFYNCTALKDVYYLGSEGTWKNISIGSSNLYLQRAKRHYLESESNLWKISLTETDHGLVFLSRSAVGVGEEDAIEVGYFPDLGYTLDSILVDGKKIDVNKFVPTGNHTVTVVFKKVCDPVAGGQCGDTIRWFLDEAGTLYLCGSGKYESNGSSLWGEYRSQIVAVEMTDAITAMPSFYNFNNLKTIRVSQSVTQIPNGAFEYCSSLQSIEIPDGVTSIGLGSFYYCTNLERVALPQRLNSIGSRAFAGCELLCEINVPDSVSSIGEFAFSGCKSLTEIHIPQGIKVINDSVFSDCSSLQEVEIPDGVTSIGNSAFSDCDGLKSVVIPDSVTTLGSSFSYCDNLERVTLSQNLTSIGSDAFAGCVLLCEINVPDSVTSIGANAFYSCDSLTEIHIPQGIKIINARVFCGCSSLQEIKIPEGVTSIGYEAFYNCDGLKEIIIPDSVTTMGNCAFRSCGNLNTVILSKNLTNIGISAFDGCKSLTEIHIPESVTTIGKEAFLDCNKLETVKVSGKISEIGEYAFNRCSNLKQIVLSGDLETVGKYAFSNCSKLKDVFYIGSDEQWNSISIGNGNDYLTGAKLHYLSDSSELAVITAGECENGSITDNRCYAKVGEQISVPYMPEAGFDLDYILVDGEKIEGRFFTVTGNHQIEAVYKKICTPVASGVCGDSIRWYIDEDMTLYLCGSGDMTVYTWMTDIPWAQYRGTISDVEISKDITCLSPYAFYECDELTTIVLSEGLTAIMQNAFQYCSGLCNIIIPGTMKTIETGAFSGCDCLTDVYYIGTESQWEEIVVETGNSYLLNAKLHYMNDMSDYLSLTVAECVNGSISLSEDIASKTDYTEIKVTYQPEVGYDLDYILVDGKKIAGLSFIATDDHIVTAVFKKVNNLVASGTRYDVTWWLDDKGIFYLTGKGSTGAFYRASSSPWYDYRNQIKALKIGPAVTGIGQYAFDSYYYNIKTVYYIGTGEEWKQVSIGSNNESLKSAPKYFLTLPSDLYFMTTGSTENGTITLSKHFAAAGETLKVSDYVPSPGYDLDYVMVDGTPIEGTSITPTGNHVITASFKKLYETETGGSCGNEAFWCMTEDGMLHIYGKGEVTSSPWSDTITHVEIADGITSISSYIFSQHDELEYVILPESMTGIGSYAFNKCSKLEDIFYMGSQESWNQITVNTGNTYFEEADVEFISDISDILTLTTGSCEHGTITLSKNRAAKGGKAITVSYTPDIGCELDYVLVDGEKIEGTSFTPTDNHVVTAVFKKLYDANFGGSCGENVFWCVTEDRVLHIYGQGEIQAMWDNPPWWDVSFESGNGVYMGPGAIVGIDIANGITSIDYSTFGKNMGAEYVILPESVTEIRSGAFADCSKLKDVFYAGGQESWNQIVVDSDNGYFEGAEVHFNAGKPELVTLSVEWNQYGTIELSSMSGLKNYTEITVTCKPDLGCVLAYITVDGQKIEGNTFTATGNNTVGAVFHKFCDPIDYGTIGENLYWFIAQVEYWECKLYIGGTGDIPEFGEEYDDEAPWYWDYYEVIREVEILEGVTGISSNAIAHYPVRAITLPSSLETVADGGLYCCELMDIYYFGSEEEWADVEIGEENGPVEEARIHYITEDDYYILSAGECEFGQIALSSHRILKDSYGYVNVSGIPDPGYIFDYALVDGVPIEDSQFKPTGNHVVTAVFRKVCDAVDGGSVGGDVDNDVYWCIDADGTLYFHGSGYIPSYDDITETPWASWQNSIKKLVIGDDITSIGRNAFENCKNLTDVTIGQYIGHIFRYAFWNCSSIETVRFHGTKADSEDLTFEYGNSELENADWIYTSASVSGTVTSWASSGSSDAAVINLLKNGVTKYTVTLPPASGSGKVSQNYQIKWIEPGTYVLQVAKGKHVTENITLTIGENDAVQNVILGLTGDMNGDGRVSAADLTMLARHISGIRPVTDIQSLANVDVDCSGDVGSEDLTKLARYVAKIITAL